jgi:hypothetical protein
MHVKFHDDLLKATSDNRIAVTDAAKPCAVNSATVSISE